MIRTSILINNYNNAPYLRACVESALTQTQPADEVIVYDDGSNDDSLSILRSFLPRIILIEGQRTGLSSRPAQANAVHQAFLRSTGDLIFLLDGDDLFWPGKVAAYAEAFSREPGVSLVQAPMEQIDHEGNPIGATRNPLKHHTDYFAATYKLNDVDFYYPTSALACARAFLEKVLPLDFSDQIELPVDTRLGIIAPLYGKIVTLEQSWSIWRRHQRAYTAQTHKNTFQLQETLKRTRVFNRFCRERGFRPIALWRNHRFYRQLLRACTPGFVYDIYFRQKQRPRP